MANKKTHRRTGEDKCTQWCVFDVKHPAAAADCDITRLQQLAVTAAAGCSSWL